MLNCLYGRIGIRDITDNIKIVNNKDIDKIIKTHNYSFIREIDDKGSLIKSDINEDNEKLLILEKNLNYNKSKSILNYNVAIAAAVTSYARMLINEYKMMDGYEVIYSDTDSIVLNKELPKEYVNNDIGKMKLEFIIKEGYFVNLKTYGIITEDNKIIIKAKGVGSAFEKIKLTIEDIKSLYNNNKLVIKRNLLFRDYIKSIIYIKAIDFTLTSNLEKRDKIIVNN